MTSPEQKTLHSIERDNPDTDVIEVSAASPVFVDATGRRRRLLRRLTFAFGGLCMVYGGLISVSLAGGPVSSSSILPLPDRDETGAQPDATPTPAPTTAQTQPIIEALPRRVTPATHRDAGRHTPSPTRTPAAPSPPKAAPSPSASTTKPVESTTTPAASPSASASTPTPTATVAASRPPAPPRPPSVSVSAENGSAEPSPPDPADATESPAPDPEPQEDDAVTLQVST